MGKKFPQKQGGAPMKDDILIREKVNEQLVKFSDKLSEGLKKTKKKFIHQMLFGIQASKDIKLSEVSRSLEEDIKLIKTENRLSRNLQDNTLSWYINDKILKDAKNKIERDTVLAVDITHIHKPYAQKMDFLTRVWDGMKKEAVNGYWVLEIIGANIYDEHLLPLYSELYSQDARGFKSENKQILKAIAIVNSYTKGKGIYVIDRGGDRKELIKSMLFNDLRFIIRIKQDRLYLLGNNRKKQAEEIGERFIEYNQRYKLEIDNQGFKEKRVVELGKKKVKIPGIREEFWLVAIKGFGNKPMMLLTNLDKNPVIILEMYLTRWKVEESIRFLKQEYNLEDVRVRSYAGLRNTVSFLLAVFYFLSVYLGRKLKLNILLKKIYEKAKRFFQIPPFKHYALADGIFRILFNTRWRWPWGKKKEQSTEKQLFLFSLLA